MLCAARAAATDHPSNKAKNESADRDDDGSNASSSILLDLRVGHAKLRPRNGEYALHGVKCGQRILAHPINGHRGQEKVKAVANEERNAGRDQSGDDAATNFAAAPAAADSRPDI